MFLDSITSNRLVHNLYFWGVVEHPYALAQICKYCWYVIFMFLRKLNLYLYFWAVCGLQQCVKMAPRTTIFFLFLFLDTNTTNKFIHNVHISGVVDHPYALAQNWKYHWYFSCPKNKTNIIYFPVCNQSAHAKQNTFNHFWENHMMDKIFAR